MPCRLSGTKAVSGKAIHTRMGKILQQPFGILLFEISNDNSFGFDIYFLVIIKWYEYAQSSEGKHGIEILVEPDEGHPVEQEGNAAQPRGQSVDAVDEVDGIDDETVTKTVRGMLIHDGMEWMNSIP